jgi:hypothetical protein
LSGQNTRRTGRDGSGPCDSWRERDPCGNSSRSEGWIRDLPRLGPESSGLVSSPAHSLCRLPDRQGRRLPSQWNHNAVRNGKDTEPRKSRLRPRKGKPQSVKGDSLPFSRRQRYKRAGVLHPPQRSGGASESGACVGLRCNSGRHFRRPRRWVVDPDRSHVQWTAGARAAARSGAGAGERAGPAWILIGRASRPKRRGSRFGPPDGWGLTGVRGVGKMRPAAELMVAMAEHFPGGWRRQGRS